MNNHFAQIAAFALGTGVQAMLGFLSVPLLVRALGVDELGKWSVLEGLFLFGAQLALLGFNQTIIKFIAKDGFAPWPAMRSLATALLPVALLVATIAGLVTGTLLGQPLVGAVALGLLLCLEFWNVLGLTAARAASMPFVFSIALITRGAMILGALSIATFLAPHWLDTATDTIWLWVGSYAVVTVVLTALVRLHGRKGPAPGREDLHRGLRYGLPLLGALLLAQVLQYADRAIVSAQLGFSEAGRYFVHAKIASAMAMAALPVQLWWPTARFIHLKDGDKGERFFIKSSVIGVTFFSVSMLALSLIAPILFSWFAPNETFDGRLFLVLITAQCLLVSSIFFNVALLDQGRTSINVKVWGLTALIQLTSQSVLVSAFGLLGAGIGALIGATCAIGLQYTYSQKFMPIAFPRLILGLPFVAAALVASTSFKSAL